MKPYQFSINEIMYIELKTGYSDDGLAWIGFGKTSKTGRMMIKSNL